MKVIAIKCPKCGDTVFSRAVHDYRGCSCPDDMGVAIDGGFSYTRISGVIDGGKTFAVKVRATKKQLYEDWNSGKDKFGLIKNENGLKRAVNVIRSKKKE